MLSLLRGVVRHKSPFTIVLDVQGVGYEVLCTQAAYEAAANATGEYELVTRLIVREDSMTLFGFSSLEERSMFDLVIGVSGIGPRTGHAILSSVGAGQLKEAIRSNQLHLLTSIPGIGKKTAERLVLELRDKLLKEEFAGGMTEVSEGGSSQARSEALQALVALGYPRAVAEKAIRSVLKSNTDAGNSTEALIKAALREAVSAG